MSNLLLNDLILVSVFGIIILIAYKNNWYGITIMLKWFSLIELKYKKIKNNKNIVVKMKTLGGLVQAQPFTERSEPNDERNGRWVSSCCLRDSTSFLKFLQLEAIPSGRLGRS